MRSRGFTTGGSLALAVMAIVGSALIVLAPAFALAIAPLAALLFALISGRAPGEEILAELRDRLAAPRHARAVRTASPVLPLVRVRSGISIAFALAMRPPPLGAQPIG